MSDLSETGETGEKSATGGDGAHTSRKLRATPHIRDEPS